MAVHRRHSPGSELYLRRRGRTCWRSKVDLTGSGATAARTIKNEGPHGGEAGQCPDSRRSEWASAAPPGRKEFHKVKPLLCGGTCRVLTAEAVQKKDIDVDVDMAMVWMFVCIHIYAHKDIHVHKYGYRYGSEGQYMDIDIDTTMNADTRTLDTDM